MIAAAAVITRAVLASPSATARLVLPSFQVLLADARDQEDLVVHREAEEDREHHHRHEGGDREGARPALVALGRYRIPEGGLAVSQRLGRT